MSRVSQSTLQQSQILRLQKRIRSECPQRGFVPPLNQKVAFRSLPLSEETLLGLEQGTREGHTKKRKSNNSSNNNNNNNNTNNNNKSNSGKKQFLIMTDIQNACIPHALYNRDILGAAQTGSGKTLAFLIPLLEKLYRRQYTPHDGPGAIILSPTRELAIQTFQVLRSIGSHHNFSAGLLVGGKKEFGLEQHHVTRMNIIVATPGRLLQHLEQTAGLNCERVCILILDEADRILDMGFRDQMLKILDYLPPGNHGEFDNDKDKDNIGRQTMLFSATQTKRVSDLAALSLNRPEYIGVHDKEATKTPKGLEQSLLVVPLPHKLDAIFSFIKSHLRCKTIVFFSSCSQVRHVWEVFCTLQPGIPLMALQGKLKQETRTKIYFDFLQRPHAVLFATDVASRGLDFPNVDWVLQADAPEDIEMYIHRVGRTARYCAGGKALLMVTPQEEKGMLTLLSNANISVKTCSMNPKKAVVVSKKAAAVVAASPDRNLLAKKAFKSYLRSIHLMPNKEIFPEVMALPLEDYAYSLGLASVPTLRFLKKLKSREEEQKKKNVNYRLQQLKDEIKAERLEKKMAKLGQLKQSDEISKVSTSIVKPKVTKKQSMEDDSEREDDKDNDEGLLVVKQVHEWGNVSQPMPEIHLDKASKSRHAKKIRVDGSSTGINQKFVFNDEGEIEDDMVNIVQSASSSNPAKTHEELVSAKDNYLESVKDRLKITRQLDRKEEKERIQQKHKKTRLKDRKDEDNPLDLGNNGGTVTLVTHDSEEENGSVSRSYNEESQSTSFYEDTDNDSLDSDAENTLDVKEKEELALAILGS